MAAIRKTDESRSPYENLDDIVRDLTFLCEEAGKEVPRAAREEEARRERPEPALPRATLQPRWAQSDGADPSVVQAADAPHPERPVQQTPSARRTLHPVDPPPAFFGSVRQTEETEPRRKPILRAAAGICSASAILLGVGAYTIIDGTSRDRLTEARMSPPAEAASSALLGPMLLQAGQSRLATSAEPNPASAAAAAPGKAGRLDRAPLQRTEDQRPPAGVEASRSPATAPVASEQPEPNAPAPSTQAEMAIAALPPPAAPGRPRFSAEETGRLIARARSTMDRTADIAAARLLLQRAMDMGDPEAAFALAETFDPNVLSHMHVFGIRPDAAVARRLYQQALDGGVDHARPRLAALGN